MRVQEPGWLNANLLLLGSRTACSYIVQGETLALIGAGVAWEVAKVEEHFDRFEVDRKRFRYLVISHAHHDHCGVLPYLIRKYPHIETIASPYCAHLLAKQNVVGLMEDLNRKTCEKLGRPSSHAGVPLGFEPIAVTRRVSDGDRLDLGDGMTLRFFETPGHSRCSLSVYVPELKALFPGDSIPYPATARAELTVTANHDYDDYLRSLRKLAKLPVEIVGFEHGGALVGEDADRIVEAGLRAALQHRERIRKRFDELGDLDRLVDEIASKYRELELFQELPADVMKAIVRRMVGSAVGKI